MFCVGPRITNNKKKLCQTKAQGTDTALTVNVQNTEGLLKTNTT